MALPESVPLARARPVGTVPDMPNMHIILTLLGHRFGHQLGLDESSGRNSTTFLHGIAFRVYEFFPK